MWTPETIRIVCYSLSALLIVGGLILLFPIVRSVREIRRLEAKEKAAKEAE